MKISDAFRNAMKTAAGNMGETVRFLVTEGCMTLICLSPLLLLSEKGPLKYLAALSALLWICIMLPARVNAARAMQDSQEGGHLFSRQLADFTDYGRKLGYGLKKTLILLIWGAPLIAALIYAWDQFAGSTDGLTVMQNIHRFGGKDLKTGMIYLLLILLGLILLFAAGIAFHSGDRHVFVLERKGLLKGHRGKMVLCWCCSLVFLAPLFIAVVIVLFRYAPLLDDVSGVLQGTAKKPSTRTTLVILAVGAALTVPLLPLRSLVPGAYVNGLKE